jgi:hypothetical protein
MAEAVAATGLPEDEVRIVVREIWRPTTTPLS